MSLNTSRKRPSAAASDSGSPKSGRMKAAVGEVEVEVGEAEPCAGGLIVGGGRLGYLDHLEGAAPRVTRGLQDFQIFLDGGVVCVGAVSAAQRQHHARLRKAASRSMCPSVKSSTTPRFSQITLSTPR